MYSRFFAGVLACALAWMPAVCMGQAIVRVEEDWELRVVQPDPQIDAPQVTTCMLPFGSDSDILFQLDLNHASTPSYSAGGLQLRICDEEACYSSVRLLSGIKLNQPSETLSWTQVVQQTPSGFLFGIINGSSASFGALAGPADVAYITAEQAGTTTLNAYDAQLSLENSEITFASNRIGWLKLRHVRIYYANGQMVHLPVNADIQL